jgi:hypothetical protein
MTPRCMYHVQSADQSVGPTKSQLENELRDCIVRIRPTLIHGKIMRALALGPLRIRFHQKKTRYHRRFGCDFIE